MWYYVRNNQRMGPVDADAISALVRNGTIIRQTPVWKEGMYDWEEAGRTELAVHFTSLPPVVPTYGDRHAEAFYGPQVTFEPRSLRILWLWFEGLLGIGLPLSLLCIGVPAVIAGVIVGYVLLYRLWVVIQDGKARTTPGKAVGFCFIPFFNLYWCYVAYVGLAKDLNQYCNERRIPVRRVSETLAVWWFVLLLLGLVPYVGIVTGIVALILLIVLLKQCVDVATGILERRQISGNKPIPLR